MGNRPNKVKLTKSKVDSFPHVPHGHAPVVYRDTELPGFCVRIGERTKTFYINRRVNGKPAWIKLGTYGAITPEQARRLALQMLGQMESGINPNEERKAETLRGKTLREALEEYLKTNIHLSPRSAKDYREIICRYTGNPTKYPYMDWLEKPVSAITPLAFREAYAKLGAQTPAGAEHLRSALHAICEFLLEQFDGAVISANPIKIRKEFRYRLKPRENKIADEYLPAFFNGLRYISMNGAEIAADFLQFILLNGLRRSEAARLKWSDVDFSMRLFTVQYTKNHRPHTLPITEPAMEILRRRHARKTNEYVFPINTGLGHLADPRKQMTKLIGFINQEVYPNKPLPKTKYGHFTSENPPAITFTIHDLRRTFAGIARREVGGDMTSRLLNHISGQEGAAVTKRHYLGEDSTAALRMPLERIARKIILMASTRGTEPLPIQKQPKFHRSSFVTSLFM